MRTRRAVGVAAVRPYRNPRQRRERRTKDRCEVHSAKGTKRPKRRAQTPHGYSSSIQQRKIKTRQGKMESGPTKCLDLVKPVRAVNLVAPQTVASALAADMSRKLASIALFAFALSASRVCAEEDERARIFTPYARCDQTSSPSRVQLGGSQRSRRSSSSPYPWTRTSTITTTSQSAPDVTSTSPQGVQDFPSAYILSGRPRLPPRFG